MSLHLLASLKSKARQLKQSTLAVYFVARDPHTPWLVRTLALLVAAYALSPVDLIPDFVPILGYLDDVVLVPLGVALVVKYTPAAVLESARSRAAQVAAKPPSYAAAAVVIAVWVLVLGACAYWLVGLVHSCPSPIL